MNLLLYVMSLGSLDHRLRELWSEVRNRLALTLVLQAQLLEEAYQVHVVGTRFTLRVVEFLHLLLIGVLIHVKINIRLEVFL